MLNTKKRISISLSNRSQSNSSRYSTPKKPIVYDRMVPKLQALALSELKSRTKTIDTKKRKNLTLSQRLSQSLSDSTQSTKDLLLRSSQKKLINEDNPQIGEVSDDPIKKFQVRDWKDNFYTNLLDWNFSNLICAASDSNLNFYHMAMDQDIQQGAFRKHKVGNQRTKVNSIKFSPLSTNLAIGYQSGVFRIYNYFKEEFCYSATLHTERITALDWNDGFIITGSRDRSFQVLDPRKKKTAVEFTPYHIQQILGAKICGNLIATGGNDNHVFIYDMRNPSTFLSGYTHGAAVKSMTWIHDKKLLITGGGTADKKIKFWNNTKSKIVKQIDTGSQICSITASKNTNQIVSCQGFSLNQIIVWNLNGSRRKILHGQHSNRVLYSALSPSGQYMASGAGDKKLLIWKLFPQIQSERGMLGKLQLR